MKKVEKDSRETLNELGNNLDKLLASAVEQSEELKKQNNSDREYNPVINSKIIDSSEDKKTKISEAKISENSSQEKTSIWKRFIIYIKSFFPASEKNPQVEKQNSAKIEEPTKKKSWGDMLKDPLGFKKLEVERDKYLQKAAVTLQQSGENLDNARTNVNALKNSRQKNSKGR